MTSVIIYSVFFALADPITRIFNSANNIQLQKIATVGLKLYFTAILFAGFNIIMSMFFNSVDEPKPAQVISILRGFIVIIPVAYLLARMAKMTGVWLAFPITEGIVAIIGILLFYRYRDYIFKNVE